MTVYTDRPEYQNAVAYIKEIAEGHRSIRYDREDSASLGQALNQIYVFTKDVDIKNPHAVVHAVQNSLFVHDTEGDHIDGDFGADSAKRVKRDLNVEKFKDYNPADIAQHPEEYLKALHELYPGLKPAKDNLVSMVTLIQTGSGLSVDGILHESVAKAIVQDNNTRINVNDPKNRTNGDFFVDFDGTRTRNHSMDPKSEHKAKELPAAHPLIKHTTDQGHEAGDHEAPHPGALPPKPVPPIHHHDQDPSPFLRPSSHR